MKYTLSSQKSVQEIVDTLTQEASNHKFSVLHVHTIQDTLHEKGFELANECQVLDICSAPKAFEMLSQFIDTSMILPCKISVYTQNNQTHISMVRLSKLVSLINQELEEVALATEKELIALLQKIH
jgi:uncharacterized protein (DUF302 family)